MPPTFSDLLTPEKAFIFRITHRENVPFLLHNGVHCRASSSVDPNFVEIGHPEIIGRRTVRLVDAEPGGVLSDYIPFYFTPCSPMLYNVVTGWKGLKQRSRAEIVVLVSSLTRLDEIGRPYVVADRNATLAHATLRSGRELLGSLPWDAWKARDFKHDPDKPDKVERYQAETLVHHFLPVTGLMGIITYDGTMQSMIEQAVAAAGLSIPVHVRSHWYP
ncbi:DUF4433 domain-containing protein [soil metagenome]